MKINYKVLKIILFAVFAILAILLAALAVLAILISQQPSFFLDDGTRESSIIEDLQAKGYRFVLPRDYFLGDNQGKIAILIHDADFTKGGLQTFLKIEARHHIKSAFYLRCDTEWFSQSINDFQNAEEAGNEIGFQYDCLSRANGDKTLAMQIFKAQLAYMIALFNITTTTYHGDSYNLSINNYELYNQTTWQSLGLNEVYSIKDFSYYSDTNNQLIKPDCLGDLIIVQLHTDWTR